MKRNVSRLEPGRWVERIAPRTVSCHFPVGLYPQHRMQESETVQMKAYQCDRREDEPCVPGRYRSRYAIWLKRAVWIARGRRNAGR